MKLQSAKSPHVRKLHLESGEEMEFRVSSCVHGYHVY